MGMTKSYDIYTFGETLALFTTVDTDSVVTATTYSMSATGAEANFAVATYQLGLDVFFRQS